MLEVLGACVRACVVCEYCCWYCSSLKQVFSANFAFHWSPQRHKIKRKNSHRYELIAFKFLFGVEIIICYSNGLVLRSGFLRRRKQHSKHTKIWLMKNATRTSHMKRIAAKVTMMAGKSEIKLIFSSVRSHPVFVAFSLCLSLLSTSMSVIVFSFIWIFASDNSGKSK